MMSLCLPGPGLWRACVLVCSPALSCLGRGMPACSSAALLCLAWPWAVACLRAPLRPCCVPPGPGPWHGCMLLPGPWRTCVLCSVQSGLCTFAARVRCSWCRTLFEGNSRYAGNNLRSIDLLNPLWKDFSIELNSSSPSY